MNLLKGLAGFIILIYVLIIGLLYALQTKLIFYPAKLAGDFKFNEGAAEINLKTSDHETIHGLFFKGSLEDVVLYFHGNAGDLSGWQFVAEDFTSLGYNFMIIDYRGYGKSSGKISESGFYEDARSAFDFLMTNGFDRSQIIIYGRSIGSGVAVDLAAKQPCKGLVLEAPFSSLTQLANEKLPFFFPSFFLKYSFDNVGKINKVSSPVLFIHGDADTLIPLTHTDTLFARFSGKKKKVIIGNAAHNDLNAFPEYERLINKELSLFFERGD
jgi:fermentation-respiration switch protein FrsA (DUF1100 family)